jgi:hypothetical protein
LRRTDVTARFEAVIEKAADGSDRSGAAGRDAARARPLRPL